MTIIFFVDIDKILRQRGITLTELAEKAGMSKGALSNIRQRKAISMTSLSKIATGLGEQDILKLVDTRIEKIKS